MPEDQASSPVAGKRRRSTLADVARLAGVSSSSASMALSDSPRISAPTKETVRRAARELAYYPHAAGRALRMQRVGALAVAIPDSSREIFRRPFLSLLLSGVVEVASAADMTTVLSARAPGQDERSAYERLARSRAADGIVIVETRLHSEVLNGLGVGVPVTVVGKVPAGITVSSVSSADEQGAHDVVSHLVRVHGARRIAHVRGGSDRASTGDKRAGYERALREAGLVVEPALAAFGDYDAATAAQVVRRMTPLLARCDGVFFDSDQMAAGAWPELVEAGLGDPADLPVVGFDDYVEDYHGPGLTTVRVDRAALGRLAASSLLQHIEDGDAEADHQDLVCPVVVRTSCGCLGG